MPSRKKIFALLVIGVALFASYFIISFSSKEASAENSGGESKTLASEIKKGAELLTKSVLNIIQSGDGDASGNESPEDKTLGNLTDYFAQIISEQVKEKNSGGPTQKDDGSPAILAPTDADIERELTAMLSGENSQVAAGAYHPKVYEKKLNISQDTSRSKQEKYVSSVMSIINSLGSLPETAVRALEEISDKKDPSVARQLAATYGTIGDDLSKIEIPTNWPYVHKAILSHFYSAQSIWENIANFESDPLQAIVSTQELQILAQSSMGIPELIGQEMLKNGLQP